MNRVSPIKSNMLILVIGILLLIGCEKKDDSFTAGFDYEFLDDNNVRFTNESDGEYYSLSWDFGKGDDPVTTTNKKETFDIYYPEAGDYEVSLKVTDFTGNNKSVTKTVTISKTDLVLSFTAEIDPDDANYVNLTNTTIGEFDSFQWIYRDEEIEDQTEISAYFPFSGTYTIELKVSKDGNTFSITQTVTITEDDPDYAGKYQLVWSDEFNGSEVNTDYWTFETGASGWGNNELQNYTSGDNVEVKDGTLIITARKIDENTAVGSYTSTRMITKDKKEFKYGRMEIRAKLPSGRGIWPAIWMLGANFGTVGWPACGEIDIMEYVGYQPNVVHSTVHTTAGYGVDGNGSSMTLETCEEELHNYGVIWTSEKLEFYVDSTDNIIHTYEPATKTEENWPFNNPAFFILNIAVGGDWGGAQGIDNDIFPQSMEIDYVRVYQ